jgi:hypothetical protein
MQEKIQEGRTTPSRLNSYRPVLTVKAQHCLIASVQPAAFMMEDKRL